MCTHLRYVTNKYTGEKVLVSCGKCPACQEAKALNRANRIKNTYDGSNIALFITLTYKNEFIPYIRKSDIDVSHGTQFLPVYRDAHCRRVRSSSDYQMRFKTTFEPKTINEIYVEYNEDFSKDSLRCLSNGDSDKVSIPYYKDIQDFEKRLRIILQRRGYTEGYKYYQCCELGPTTHRSHFHALLFIRPCHEALFRDAILQAWPFADSWRTKRNIEVASNAAAYVAKYVNRDSSIPSFFTQNSLRQKHSYSQGFGVGNFAFTFSELEKRINDGDVSYNVLRKVSGINTTVNLPIPKYVINRYFPLFKGYTRIDSDKIPFVLSSIIRYRDGQKMPLTSFPLDYSHEDYRKITVQLKNAYKRVVQFGYEGNVEDYARLFCRAWSRWKSTVFRLSFDDVVTADDNFLHYDNLIFYVPNDIIPSWDMVRAPTLDALRSQISDSSIILNPNHNPIRQLHTQRLEEIYRKSVKKRKVTNFAMSNIYGDV